MRNLKFTGWQDGVYYIGYINDYPEYHTQGFSKDELIENLKDLLIDLESGQISYIRKTEELTLA